MNVNAKACLISGPPGKAERKKKERRRNWEDHCGEIIGKPSFIRFDREECFRCEE